MPISIVKSRAGLVFQTKLGWMGLAGTNRGVSALTFGHDSPAQVQLALGQRQNQPHCPDAEWIENAHWLLEQYAAGEPVDPVTIPIDVAEQTHFQCRVREQLQAVPYGERISYGELAKIAGSPGAARAVGNIMANNRIPLIVPCHRVVGSGGRLGGFSAPQGIAMKKRLLEMEKAAVRFQRGSLAFTS